MGNTGSWGAPPCCLIWREVSAYKFRIMPTFFLHVLTWRNVSKRTKHTEYSLVGYTDEHAFFTEEIYCLCPLNSLLMRPFHPLQRSLVTWLKIGQRRPWILSPASHRNLTLRIGCLSLPLTAQHSMWMAATHQLMSADTAHSASAQ